MKKKRPQLTFWGHPLWESLCIPPLLLTHRLSYDLIGAILSKNDTNYGHFLVTSWDSQIPYIPFFVLPYLLTWAYAAFIFIYAVICRTYDKQTFRYFYLSFIVLTGLECFLWYNFPASILIRASADVLSNSGLFGSLTAYVYERATPWNVIPSAHIAFAYIAWLFSKHFAPSGHRWLFLFFFFLITLSVVFIKNHYLVDIAGGILLGHLVYKFVFLPASRHKILVKFSTTAIVGFHYVVFAFATSFYLLILGNPWS